MNKIEPKPWVARAACRDIADPNIFFPEHSQAQFGAAKQVCRACPVRDECLDYALRNNIEAGCWGGCDPLERKRIRRKPRGVSVPLPEKGA